MLQNMQKKVIEEGEKEKALYDKFACYCKTFSNTELRKAIAADKAKIEELVPALEGAKGQLSQLREDLKKHDSESKAGNAALSAASSLREKEASAFAARSAEDKKNMEAINKAITALKKGKEGAFLQTRSAQHLQRMLAARQDLNEEDRQDVLSFLSSKEDAPSSDVILGILETMLEQTEKTLADATSAEHEAKAEYEQVMAAKKKELEAIFLAIEKKSARAGELAVKLVDMESDLTDTKTSLKDNESLLRELDKSCETQQQEYEKNKKLRSEELAALSDTIKLLNDDDALELFKKTLPSGAGSFLQVKVNARMMRERALETIKSAIRPGRRPRLDFIALALRGKKIGFEAIIKMIDEMVFSLERENTSDKEKKSYCAAEFDSADDKKKTLENSISDMETSIDDTQESIAAVTEEMKAVEQGIRDLDKSVADATAQRKAENEEYTELMASDAAAKEVLLFARNRLQKFYNPSLYVPPPKAEISEQDRIVAGLGGGTTAFIQLGSGVSVRDAPPPPPETVSAYKKSKSSTGVIEMIDLLVRDLDKEMATHESEEKAAQADYEMTMADSANKRKADSKSLDEKEGALAGFEEQLQKHQFEHKSVKKEYGALLQYIRTLHSECDWLLKYFTVRKEARVAEIDALQKAKAILNGADFSLAQTNARHFVLHAV